MYLNYACKHPVHILDILDILYIMHALIHEQLYLVRWQPANVGTVHCIKGVFLIQCPDAPSIDLGGRASTSLADTGNLDMRQLRTRSNICSYRHRAAQHNRYAMACTN